MMPSRVGRCQDSSPVTRMKRRDDALPCWRVAESGCGRERLQSSAVRTGGLTSVSCVFAVLDGAWQRVSRLTVVPRGLHLRYLRADRFDTASTTRGISTTLLRISGADEHRYARYGRASTTDTADSGKAACGIALYRTDVCRRSPGRLPAVSIAGDIDPCDPCDPCVNLETALISSGSGIQWVPYVSHRRQAKRQGGAHGHAQAQCDARA